MGAKTMQYPIYDFVMNFDTEEEAIKWANGIDWDECELRWSNMPTHSRRVTTIENANVDMYYDYGADYYFFVDCDVEMGFTDEYEQVS